MTDEEKPKADTGGAFRALATLTLFAVAPIIIFTVWVACIRFITNG